MKVVGGFDMRVNLVCALLMGAAISACGGEEETVTPIAPGTGATTPGTAPAEVAEPVAPAMPTITLSPEDTVRATEVAAQAATRAFPREVRDDKTLAQVFLYLAATSESEDVLVCSLSALAGVWTVVPRQVEREYTMASDELIQVLAARILDTRPRIQAAAIEGGAFVFRGEHSNETLLDAYLALAVPTQPATLRYAILNKVWQARNQLASPERLQRYIDALDAAEPWLVSIALWRLESLVPREATLEATVRAKALERTQHADPGVRGRAISLLATLARRMNEGEPERVAATARAIEMIGDENPFTKSAAMNSAVKLEAISAIHTMVPFLGDATRNTYDIEGWTTLAGGRGSVHHDGSAWSQVRDSALGGIKNLSRRHDRDTMFDYDIEARNSGPSLDAAAIAANAWYTANRASLPE